MEYVLLLLTLIAAVLLILAVLIQPGKGDMISGMSGIGGQFNSMLGSRKATDFLTKLTVGLAAAIMFLSLVTNLFFVGNTDGTTIKAPTEGQQVEETLPEPPTEPLPPAE